MPKPLGPLSPVGLLTHLPKPRQMPVSRQLVVDPAIVDPHYAQPHIPRPRRLGQHSQILLQSTFAGEKGFSLPHVLWQVPSRAGMINIGESVSWGVELQ